MAALAGSELDPEQLLVWDTVGPPGGSLSGDFAFLGSNW